MALKSGVANIHKRWVGVASIFPGLVIWQLVGMTGKYRFLPSLDVIAVAGVQLIQQRGLLSEAVRTLRFFTFGIVLAVPAGILVGVLMGRFQSVEYSLDFLINTFMAAPISALVPVLIVLFGLGPESIVATVFMFAFFVIVVNVYTGVRETPVSLVEMARSFGATEPQIMRRIVLPYSIPLMLTGIRMGLARGVNGVILGEMLIAVVGVGGMLMFYGGAFRIPELWAMVILVVTFSLILNGVMSYIERRTAPWKQ